MRKLIKKEQVESLRKEERQRMESLSGHRDQVSHNALRKATFVKSSVQLGTSIFSSQKRAGYTFKPKGQPVHLCVCKKGALWDLWGYYLSSPRSLKLNSMFLQKISMWIQKGVFSHKRSWVIILRNRKVTSEKMTGRAVGCCVRSMWQEGRMCRHMILKVVLCLCVWRCLGLHRMTCSLLGEYKAELFTGFANHVTSCQQTNRQEDVSWLISHLRASYITVSEPRGKLLILILKMGCFGGSCFSFVKKSNYYYNIYYLN